MGDVGGDFIKDPPHKDFERCPEKGHLSVGGRLCFSFGWL